MTATAAAFITFEGIDGSGKSTHLQMLARVLMKRDLKIVTTREPGGTPLGVRLRDALLDVHATLDPLAELLLYAADRAQHVRTLLRPALASGCIVLSDRYADATLAYQGAGRNLPPQWITDVIKLATDGLTPDLTLVFDLPVAAAQARAAARAARRGGVGDRLDLEGTRFHTRVRDAYLQIAAASPERVRIIDASGSSQQTHQRVLDVVLPFLEQRG